MAGAIEKENFVRSRHLSFPNINHLNRRSVPCGYNAVGSGVMNNEFVNSKRQKLTVCTAKGISVNERPHSAPPTPTPTNLRTEPPTWPFRPVKGNEFIFNSSSSINKSSSCSHDSAQLRDDTTSMTQACSVSRGPADPEGSAGAPVPVKNMETTEIMQTSRSSKARQKKFHRHFKQVDIDEKVLNYYSCALVGDILLQGHLYITENFFAFYSNVFGYVTKLLIPTVDVLKISKEKTAKIIPNAVGISTEDEKHVFGSLLSRDSTYKFMLEVWKAANSSHPVVNIAPPETIKPEASDEDSTGSSGNEEQSSFISNLTTGASSDGLQKFLKKRSLVVTALDLNNSINSHWSSFKATTLLVVAVVLLVFLFSSAGFLLYRIVLIQNHFKDFSLSGRGDIYEDILKWQSTLHSTSADKIQEFLSVNLNQIMKIRLSLEALSMLMSPENNNNNSNKSNLHPRPWNNEMKDSVNIGKTQSAQT